MNSPSCSNVSWNNTGCLGPIGSEAVSGRSPDPSRYDPLRAQLKSTVQRCCAVDGLKPPGLCCSCRNVVLFSCDLETFSSVTATVTSRCSCILSTFHRTLVCGSLAYSVNYFRRKGKEIYDHRNLVCSFNNRPSFPLLFRLGVHDNERNVKTWG
jgi:hypothetical protein